MAKKKNKRWILNKRKDYYYRLAKRENYRSRSTYKLFQIDKQLELMKLGDNILDLGCAPGGWLQASRKITGENGTIVGIDLLKVDPFEDENIFIIEGDMRNDEIVKKIKTTLFSAKKIDRFDGILCDASPNISGTWEVDHARSVSLTLVALSTATKLLKKKGFFVVKLFQGYLFDEYFRVASEYFQETLIVKPIVCRRNSAEVYIIGKNFNEKIFKIHPKSPLADLMELKF